MEISELEFYKPGLLLCSLEHKLKDFFLLQNGID